MLTNETLSGEIQWILPVHPQSTDLDNGTLLWSYKKEDELSILLGYGCLTQAELPWAILKFNILAHLRDQFTYVNPRIPGS